MEHILDSWMEYDLGLEQMVMFMPLMHSLGPVNKLGQNDIPAGISKKKLPRHAWLKPHAKRLM
ncbi:MAG TPA: hypothetical protein ENN34_12925 [Deltaproteobacteria bacterium]|nr:hypothetical protein [Deltaproteobacteria bacterium]